MVDPEDLEAFQEHTLQAVEFYRKHKDDSTFHDIITNLAITQGNGRHAGLKGLGEFFPRFAPAVELYKRDSLTHLLAATNLLNLAVFAQTINDATGAGMQIKPEKRALFRQDTERLYRTITDSSLKIYDFYEGLATLLGVHAYQRSVSPLDLLVDKEVLRDVHRRILPSERAFVDYQDSCWNVFNTTISLCPESPCLCYITFINDGATEIEKSTALILKRDTSALRKPEPQEEGKNILELLHPDTIAFAKRIVTDHRSRTPEFKEAREALAHYHRQWAAGQAAVLYR